MPLALPVLNSKDKRPYRQANLFIMKAKALTKNATDQQPFILHPNEIDKLMVMTEGNEFEEFTARWTLYHYLLHRRAGVPHHEAISNAELAGYHRETHPTLNPARS